MIVLEKQMRQSALPRLELAAGFRLVSAAGEEVAISSRKNRALLAILALSPDCTATRQQVAALLWADRGELQARNSLRQALVALRRDIAALGTSPLDMDGDRLRLDPMAISVDMIEFLRRADEGEWETAAALYAGTLLAGFSIASNEFETWLRERRDLYLSRAIAVYEQLAGSRQGEERVRTAKQLLALDPLREASYRALISAYAEGGEIALARKQYDLCRETLRRELNVTPTLQTEMLYQSLSGKSAGAASSRPTRPTVAVLPFADLSGSADQQHLCSGIANDIVSELSRFRSLTVIGRNSTLTIDGAETSLGEIGARLGAAYLLSGAIRAVGQRVRISVEMIATESGRVVWAESFDREMADIFALQDEVARVIASTLTGHLETDIASLAARKHPGSIAAYDLALRGLQLQQRVTRKDNPLAVDYLDRALALDPNYAEAYSWLAIALLASWQFDHDQTALKRSGDVARKGVELDPYSARCHLVLGYCLLCGGDLARAEQHHRRAYGLNPGDAHVLAHMGLLSAYMGRADEAFAYLAEAERLNPYPPEWYEEFYGLTAFVAGKYEDAIRKFVRAPDTFWDLLYLLACCGHLQRRDQAKAVLAQFNRLFPGLSPMEAAMAEPYWADADRARLIDGLEKAGAG